MGPMMTGESEDVFQSVTVTRVMSQAHPEPCRSPDAPVLCDVITKLNQSGKVKEITTTMNKWRRSHCCGESRLSASQPSHLRYRYDS
ncbi:hypothetical protein J6590_052854 [Homalodisca vitripennis]|nr:hypothetical protein J6590_052854 [Homalodisca vitripennis]